MEITIDEARTELISGNPSTNKFAKALVVAIDTMHKYQKIAELYDYWRSSNCEYTISCMENIGKVLKDGNDD